MKKPTTPPQARRKNPFAMVPLSITLHPTILAQVDTRNTNRSQQINADLARLYLIEANKADLTPEERRRLKALTMIADIPQQFAALRQEAGVEPPKPTMKHPKPHPKPAGLKQPFSPWPGRN